MKLYQGKGQIFTTLLTENNVVSWITGSGKKIEVNAKDFYQAIKNYMKFKEFEQSFNNAKQDVIFLITSAFTSGKNCNEILTKLKSCKNRLWVFDLI